MNDDSIWFRKVRRTRYAALDRRLDVDVAIAGAGITGLTAAVLLADEGHRVAVLEAHRIGSGTTGRTSAHVTEVPDLGYRALLQHGEERARAVIEHNRAGLDFIDTLVAREQINCDFARVPAYLIGEQPADLETIEAECRAANQLGQAAELADKVPLPWHVAGAVRYPRQAAFQPVRYLLALAKLAAARGAIVVEQTPVRAFREERGRLQIDTPLAEVRAGAFIQATHTPLGINLVQAEVAPYRSYIIAIAIPEPLQPGLFWDTSRPYFYIRHYDGEGTPIAIVGGADHKTGHDGNAERHFAAVAEYARARFGRIAIEQQWSAQFYEPADGLPYIGRSPRAENVYIATGLSGVGLVQGTMAAMDLAAAVRGEGGTTAFAPTRLAIGAVPRLLSENVDVAASWLGDRLSGGAGVDDLARGEGRIARIDGRRRAVFRDDRGRLHLLSPVCTHMGCIVRWNSVERSWDCPCHGARYAAATGAVLEGPALAGLASADAEADEAARDSGS